VIHLGKGGIDVISKIRQLREKMGISQTEAAKRLGIVRTTYSNYEAGNREPDVDTIKKMAEFFEVSVDYLLGRTDDPKRVLKEQARQLIDMIDLELTNDEIIEQLDLYVDGIKVEEEEVRIFVDLVRGSRIRMKRGQALASQENKS
jgi:transcriptional regulator with XRE-family HTH domain